MASGGGGVGARIKADLATAAEQFPSVGDLAVDGECFSFSIAGQAFTAVLPDVYGARCDVYGPDDFEASCSGSVADIVAAVLRRLDPDGAPAAAAGASPSSGSRSRRRRSASVSSGECGTDEGAVRYVPASSEDHCCDDDEDSAASSASSPRGSPAGGVSGSFRAMEALGSEMEQLEALGIRCSIDIATTHQALVRLALPIPEEISRSTAEAWGLDRSKPLCVSLQVTEGHFRRDASERLEAKFFQEKTAKEGFAKLDCGVQLANMSKMFWRLLSASAAGAGAWGAQAADARAVPDPIGGVNAEAQERLAAKKAAIVEEAKGSGGPVLLPLAVYISRRLPHLHEYCVICDEPLVFAPLLRPTVCTRSLCSYSVRAFGAAIAGEFGNQNADLEVWDLLIAMAICALTMTDERMRLLFEGANFPALFLPGKTEPELCADGKGFTKLRALLRELAFFRAKRAPALGALWLNEVCGRKSTSDADPLLGPLVGWIWYSNRSYLLSIPQEVRISQLGTPFQYLLLSAPPEMESKFQALKEKHGSEFCFHGSASANWHCILRQGLRNASGTKLMSAGQAHGPGIYLARESSISAQYCAMGSRGSSKAIFGGSSTAKAPPAALPQPSGAPEWTDSAASAALAAAGFAFPAAGPAAGPAGKRARNDPSIDGTRPEDLGGEAFEKLSGEVAAVAVPRAHDPEDMTMLAICEVAKVPSLNIVQGGSIWVCPDEAAVVTRFFLVYHGAQVPSLSLGSASLRGALSGLTSRFMMS